MGEVIERPHCVISGSKMKQFLACPTHLYAHPDDLIDDRPKTAAEEGERAHDLAERAFWEGDAAFEGCRNKRMIEGAKLYREALETICGEDKRGVTTEQFLTMGEHFGFEDSQFVGGYYDAMYVSEERKVIHCADYKFGLHVVEPDTPQLTFYILAMILKRAREKFEVMPIWDDEIIAHIRTYYEGWAFAQTIVQPKRVNAPTNIYPLPQDALEKFVRDFCAAVAIYQDSGRFDDSTCHTNGYCKYCPKARICSKSAVREKDDCAFTFDAPIGG